MVGTKRAKFTALLFASSAHAALAVTFVGAPEVLTEGTNGGIDVRLGSSFQDMAVGVLTGDPAEAAHLAEPQEVLKPERVEAAPTDTAAEPLEPERQSMAQQAPHRVSERPVIQARAALSEPAAFASRAMEMAQALPLAPLSSVAVVSPAPPAAERPAEAQSDETSQLTEAEVTEPVQTLQGAEPDSTAVSRSLRPMRRSAEFEAMHKPKPQSSRTTTRAQPGPKPQRTRAVSQGNGNRSARSGANGGTRSGTARSSGSGGKSRSAGNAAVSNYPGVVRRCVMNRARPNARGRGSATVSFRVSGNGAITSVALAGRSGNAKLDRAAVAAVRRVGRCPKPPAGARRSFSIRISAR